MRSIVLIVLVLFTVFVFAAVQPVPAEASDAVLVAAGVIVALVVPFLAVKWLVNVSRRAETEKAENEKKTELKLVMPERHQLFED